MAGSLFLFESTWPDRNISVAVRTLSLMIWIYDIIFLLFRNQELAVLDFGYPFLF